MGENKKMSMKKAAMINAFSKYFEIVRQLIFSAILSRLLSPEDYGIVAVVTVFTTFFAMFSDMGLGTAVVQRRDLDEDDIQSIYTLTVYIGIGMAILFSIFSFPMSWFYGDSVYLPIGILLSLTLLFSSFNTVPNAILNREKRFVLIAVRTITIALVSGIVTIILAFMGFKYYSLVIQSILSAVLTYLWNKVYVRIKFRTRIKKDSIHKVFSYSGYQFAFNIVNYICRNLDNLLTGKFMGAAELGYYNKAYSLMLYPINNLSGVITPILHPILSDYQDKKEEMYRKYMSVVRLLSVIGVFVATYCFWAGEELITIMYGDQWIKSVACFKLLTFSLCFQMITSSTGAIFQSLGKTKLLFVSGSITTCLSVAGILIGVSFGKIQTLALGVSIAYIGHFLVAFYMLIKRGFEYRLRDFYFGLWREGAILVLLIVTIVCCYSRIQFANLFLSAFVKIVILGIVYLIGLLITGDAKMILNLVGVKLNRKK